MVTAHGELHDEGVTVPDQGEGSRLFDKGAYGRWSGGELELDLLEAAYLVEADRLEVAWPESGSPMAVRDLLARQARAAPGSETRFLAYRDFRSRGLVVRAREDGEFDGWTRGAQPPRQKPSVLIAPRAEGAQTTPADLQALITEARGLGRSLILSVVDEESDVTHYEVDDAQITGQVPDPAPEHAKQASARLLDDRAILFEGPRLQEAGYGNDVGGEVFLSLAEAHHLARHGMGLVDTEGTEVAAQAVLARATELHPEAEHMLSAYSWLRELDLVPKTGLKFGVHFRVYQDEPGESHAPFLVHALAGDAGWTHQEVARFVRLAHSVRKRPVLWSPAGTVTLSWTRP